jgi:hypothetical protein
MSEEEKLALEVIQPILDKWIDKGLIQYSGNCAYEIAKVIKAFEEKLLKVAELKARLAEIKDFPGRRALMINNTQTVGERITELQEELKKAEG